MVQKEPNLTTFKDFTRTILISIGWISLILDARHAKLCVG